MKQSLEFLRERITDKMPLEEMVAIFEDLCREPIDDEMISSVCNLIEFLPQIYFSNFEKIILRQFRIVSILVQYFQFLFLEISLYNKVYQKKIY